jgi:hypothetical protein
VAKFGDDGRSVILDDGRVFPAAAVILATGYQSTWRPIFDGEFNYAKWIQYRDVFSLMLLPAVSVRRYFDGTARPGPASFKLKNKVSVGLREPR